jgi:hypothetical protein
MKALLQRLVIFISSLLRPLRVLINSYADEAIFVVSHIVNAVDSGKLDFIVTLTKTKKDDRILTVLKKVINEMFPGIDGRANLETAIKALVEGLKEHSPAVRAAIYFKMASQIIKALAAKDGNSLKDSDTDLITQIAFSRLKHNIAL